MHLTRFRIAIAFVAVCLLACSTIGFGAGRARMTVLQDAPAIEFSDPGWDHTNITNPYLLTPDSMTNAMIGISRLKPGQRFLRGGPIIAETLTAAEMSKALSARLAGKNDLRVETVQIAGRDVAHAVYTGAERNGEEYAIPLDGFVVHVLLQAKPGHYYDDGARVAAEIVHTLRPH